MSQGDGGLSTKTLRAAGAGLVGIAGLILVVGFVYWFIFRVEVDADELMVLVNKTGQNLPAELRSDFGDQVVLYDELVDKIASSTGQSADDVRITYKGVQQKVNAAGRYFVNRYYYKPYVFPATLVKPNEVGVKIRKYGRPLEFPKTVATEPDERGPVADILPPGRHDVNLLINDVQIFNMMLVPEGHVGVVTLLSGKDPKDRNTYTVLNSEKGVQRETLPPGRHPYNPYLQRVDVVDMRSHKYEMLADQGIYFPSNDSFTIELEGYIEWAIDPIRVAEVTVAYGDEEDILKKIILPNARSISRIQGSKLRAREFIGKTRLQFQQSLLAELQQECELQGIIIRSVAITDIKIPSEIASLISAREQADQEIDRSKNQIEQAKSEARLVEEEQMQHFNSVVGEARRDVVSVLKAAEQQKVVAVTQANRELEVAELELEAASKLASAIRSEGQAEANVILFNYQARTEPLKAAVSAFGDGEMYAQQFFLQKVAPSITSILTNTEGPFADIFKQFQMSPVAGEGRLTKGED